LYRAMNARVTVTFSVSSRCRFHVLLASPYSYFCAGASASSGVESAGTAGAEYRDFSEVTGRHGRAREEK
jgi:hypothetical protein